MSLSTGILHVTPSVGKGSTGIGEVVLNLALHQQSMGLQTSIWSFGTETETRRLEAFYNLPSKTIRTFSVCGPARLGYSPSLERHIISQTSFFDIVHQHGIWTGVSRATKKYRSRKNNPTVIAPHGQLDTWALKHSILKKRLALVLYEYRNLHDASCLHALSIREAEGFRAFGLHNPIAVIPNGISEDWLMNEGDGSALRKRFGLADEMKIMLFLGRITPRKGIPMLIHAMHKLKHLLADWKLIIAGMVEFSYQKELESLVEVLKMETYVRFIGPIFGQDKRDLFAAADLFVLPSYSEGAPIVILESLGAGVPILTTKASPWEDIVVNRCGWWTEISENAIADALEDIIQKPRKALREMGQRGKEMVATKYTWPDMTKRTICLYNWLLGRCERPDFVFLD